MCASVGLLPLLAFLLPNPRSNFPSLSPPLKPFNKIIIFSFSLSLSLSSLSLSLSSLKTLKQIFFFQSTSKRVWVLTILNKTWYQVCGYVIRYIYRLPWVDPLIRVLACMGNYLFVFFPEQYTERKAENYTQLAEGKKK